MPERAVRFTDYALIRMHQRDILREEVIAVLRAPASAHRSRRDGRREVRRRVGRRMLLVVYVRGVDADTVINAMWE